MSKTGRSARIQYSRSRSSHRYWKRSEATVKSHLVHLFGKLGVDNRTAAVAAARQAGVIR
jgi:hypothetical protein